MFVLYVLLIVVFVCLIVRAVFLCFFLCLFICVRDLFLTVMVESDLFFAFSCPGFKKQEHVFNKDSAEPTNKFLVGQDGPTKHFSRLGRAD